MVQDVCGHDNKLDERIVATVTFPVFGPPVPALDLNSTTPAPITTSQVVPSISSEGSESSSSSSTSSEGTSLKLRMTTLLFLTSPTSGRALLLCAPNAVSLEMGLSKRAASWVCAQSGCMLDSYFTISQFTMRISQKAQAGIRQLMHLKPYIAFTFKYFST